MSLTGKTRYRMGSSLFGSNKIILQVEVTGYDYDYGYFTPYSNWRDAKIEDLSELDLLKLNRKE